MKKKTAFLLTIVCALALLVPSIAFADGPFKEYAFNIELVEWEGPNPEPIKVPATITVVDKDGNTYVTEYPVGADSVEAKAGYGMNRITIEADGYQTVTLDAQCDSYLTPIESFILKPIVDKNSICELFGMVTDEDGNPIPGVEINWGNYGTFTDDSGFYALEAQPGTANLMVSAKGFALYAEPVSLSEGGMNKDVVLSPAQTAVLSGTVTDAGGNPVSGAEVNWDNYGTFTDATGFYSMEVEPGTANLMVSADGFDLYSEPLSIDGDSTKHVLLTAAETAAAETETGDGQTDQTSSDSSKAPKTGDEADIFPYLLLAVACAAVLFAALRYRRAYNR